MRQSATLAALLLAVAATNAPAQRTAFQHEQQLARQQQQMLQQQQKQMEQQQRAMMQQQQKWYQQQQKAMQQQQQQQLKAQQLQQQQVKAQQQATTAKATTGTATGAGTNARTPGATTTQAHSQTKTTTGTATASTATAKNGKTTAAAKTTTHAHAAAHAWRTWPHSSTASYRRLTHLKHTLDSVAGTPNPSSAQKAALRNALLGVVENSPRPASNHVLQLSNHLAAALSTRSGGGSVDTSDLALSLRAVMNSVHLTPEQSEGALSVTQNVLSTAGASTPAISAVSGDLQFLSNEVVARAQ